MAIQVPVVLFAGNDQTFTFGPIVRGSAPATILTDCAGTMTLLNAAGKPVAGASAVAFSTSGGGIYVATILGSAFNPTPGSNYTLKISLTSTLYGLGLWKLPATVEERDS